MPRKDPKEYAAYMSDYRKRQRAELKKLKKQVAEVIEQSKKDHLEHGALKKSLNDAMAKTEAAIRKGAEAQRKLDELQIKFQRLQTKSQTLDRVFAAFLDEIVTLEHVEEITIMKVVKKHFATIKPELLEGLKHER